VAEPRTCGPLVVDSILELVGNTPLVRLRRMGRETSRAEVWGKMEQQNPGGSTEDRAALAMIESAERSGALGSGGVVVEATSGNTGVGLALACTVKGYRCIVTMPESMSLERRQLLRALGATTVLTPAEEQMEGAIAAARAIAARESGAVFLGQFENPATPEAHARTTAREIAEAMEGLSFDAFVATVGTGGTIHGVAEALAALGRGDRPRVVAVEPSASAMLSRGERGPTKIQGLAPGFVPKNYDARLVDEVRTVSDADAWRTKVLLAREEGLLVGVSAGAAVKVALDVARALGPGKNVVTVLPDTGERYFSLAEYFEAEASPKTHVERPPNGGDLP
jgi:cysteine synthase